MSRKAAVEGDAKEDGTGVSSFSWVEGEDYSSLPEGLLSQPPLVSHETSELHSQGSWKARFLALVKCLFYLLKKPNTRFPERGCYLSRAEKWFIIPKKCRELFLTPSPTD